jgi:hypothetical protein
VSAVQHRQPLVYANGRALSAWTGERPLENVVADAILAARIRRNRPRGIGLVELTGGQVAIVRRTNGRLEPTRKAWLVIDVVAAGAAETVYQGGTE